MSNRTSFVVAITAAVLISAPLALARTGDDLREGVRNPATGDATRETQVIARTAKNTYGTRQSNLGAGGGAIYGCRSTLNPAAIGDPKRSTPCIRVNNLRDGKAFDFQSNRGRIIGILQSGNRLTTPKPTVAPLVTNATAVAVGLNADRVDNLHASEIVAQARTKTGLDADTVDGLQPAQLVELISGAACPTDTTLAGGGCIEKAPRAAASYAAAAAACGAAGRRLVPPDVLLHARTLSDIDLGGGEMSADVTPASVTPVSNEIVSGYATVSDAGAVDAAPQSAETAFRCITR